MSCSSLLIKIPLHFLAQPEQLLMLLQQQRHQPDLVRQRVAAVVDGGDVLAGALEEVGEGLAVGLVEGEEEFVEGVEVASG
ncbi:MAG: hypothetical protein P8074_20020 [Anaerolineales bacterium]